MMIIQELNIGSSQERLAALQYIINSNHETPVRNEYDVNNHIHSFYSFSPFSPTHAAYSAYIAGLSVIGIVDHDSVAGIKEFHEAARILGLASTGGAEVRVKFGAFDRLINSPDQRGIMYLVAHGIPVEKIDAFDSYLKRFRDHREQRNQIMVGNINRLIASSNVHLDYFGDVRPLSKADEGGSVTERHLLLALSLRLRERFGATAALVDYVEATFGINIPAKQKSMILDPENEMVANDLLSALKTSTSSYYIPATSELPDAESFVAFARSEGAIPAYAYLGDVEVSVTGDKRPQKFEDNYLEDLFVELKKINIPAVAYMPTRNTPAQIDRLQSLAKRYGMIEISGEDINSARQSFSCAAYKRPEHRHLVDSAWALVGHEHLYRLDAEQGFLGGLQINKTCEERIKYFSDYARKLRIK